MVIGRRKKSKEIQSERTKEKIRQSQNEQNINKHTKNKVTSPKLGTTKIKEFAPAKYR